MGLVYKTVVVVRQAIVVVAQRTGTRSLLELPCWLVVVVVVEVVVVVGVPGTWS